MKRFGVLLLALILMLSSVNIAFAANKQYESAVASKVGQKMPEITVYITDNSIFRLSSVLAEKKIVVVNLWASWCGPCEKEFPLLQEAYEQYKDYVEIIALSLEQSDKLDIIREYAERIGLTFPMGRDVNYSVFASLDLGHSYSIPTTFFVDNSGKIVYSHVGRFNDLKEITDLFDQFIGDK